MFFNGKNCNVLPSPPLHLLTLALDQATVSPPQTMLKRLRVFAGLANPHGEHLWYCPVLTADVSPQVDSHTWSRSGNEGGGRARSWMQGLPVDTVEVEAGVIMRALVWARSDNEHGCV